MIISEKTFENEPRQVTTPLYLDFSELPKINLKILSNAIHHSGFLCEVDNLFTCTFYIRSNWKKLYRRTSFDSTF